MTRLKAPRNPLAISITDRFILSPISLSSKTYSQDLKMALKPGDKFPDNVVFQSVRSPLSSTSLTRTGTSPTPKKAAISTPAASQSTTTPPRNGPIRKSSSSPFLVCSLHQHFRTMNLTAQAHSHPPARRTISRATSRASPSSRKKACRLLLSSRRMIRM